jgi:glycosyltransferase involved in cell wall biosynthesis
VEFWLDALSEALERNGWDVRVALAAGKFHDPAWYLEKHPLSNPIALEGTRGLREGRFLKLLEVFEETAPDIIFPVSLADALYAAAEWKRRGAKTRIVTCTHGQDLGQIRDLERCAPHIDRATTVSNRIAAVLECIPGLAGRVSHIPTGVREPSSPPRVRTALRSIAYVGRLHHAEKRAGDLIPLVQMMKGTGTTLHVAGSGPDEQRIASELAQEIAQGSVVMHGSISPERLYEEIYPNIDALVVFSEKEGGPIVAWEAMVHGVVPVVSDFIGRKEEGILRDGATALVFPVGDVAAAAAALRRLSDPVLLQTLSAGVMAGLPDDYRVAGFERNWCGALSDVLAAPATCSDQRVGRAVSPGWIARLNLGERASFVLRSILGRPFDYQDPGSEWPHSYSSDEPV